MKREGKKKLEEKKREKEEEEALNRKLGCPIYIR